MARVKRGVTAHKRHKRLLKDAEGRNIFVMPFLIPVIRIFWNRYMRTAMGHIKRRAEAEVVAGAGVAR